MNNIMFFENKQVEIFEFKGRILFNPKHVAECLDIKNVNDNISRMNNKQVLKIKNSDIGSTDIRKLNNAGENFLTESGVYKLIFKSKKEEAEKFQDWVTDEVLPNIRKYGMYAKDELLDDPDLLVEVATKYKEERLARIKAEKEKKILEEEKKINAPKVYYHDWILNNPSLTPITSIAKDYGMSPQKMNKLLHKLKVQYKVGEQWVLYRGLDDKGYTSSIAIQINHDTKPPEIKNQTQWTQKGKKFIYELLKEKINLLPIIERENKK